MISTAIVRRVPSATMSMFITSFACRPAHADPGPVTREAGPYRDGPFPHLRGVLEPQWLEDSDRIACSKPGPVTRWIISRLPEQVALVLGVRGPLAGPADQRQFGHS
ncbi:hypothetical protein [Streptomyces sp. N35]|uniref:hypothetical protein n=1 Tax=Streptomyces sp. N35 TaxID=2795730 RepID=UPI0018F6B421|nr:hypothetical protein [Streptomyces sp. N35]